MSNPFDACEFAPNTIYWQGYYDFLGVANDVRNAHIDTARGQLEDNPNDEYWQGALSALVSVFDVLPANDEHSESESVMPLWEMFAVA